MGGGRALVIDLSKYSSFRGAEEEWTWEGGGRGYRESYMTESCSAITLYPVSQPTRYRLYFNPKNENMGVGCVGACSCVGSMGRTSKRELGLR